MKNLKTMFIIVFLLFLAFFINDIFETKKEYPFPPPFFTDTEINLIESHIKLEFPESTKVIKAYWEHRDSTWLNIFFEFDKKDVGRFMKSVSWDKSIEKPEKVIDWYKVESAYQVGSLTWPVLKEDYCSRLDFKNDRRKGEELEWWKPNGEKINWAFEVSDAQLKDANVAVERIGILLEDLQESYRVYFLMSWTGLEGSSSYLREIENVFPFAIQWEKRLRESKLYPKLKKESVQN